MFLLDGLDELPNDDLRERVHKILKDASEHWNQCPIIVTSRPIDPASLREMGFHLTSIERFGEKEIRLFLASWVRALHDAQLDDVLPLAAVEYKDELVSAIDRPRIRRIAVNPVMLTCLCVVHWNEKRLPEGRSRVYYAVLRWLIRARAELREKEDFSERFAWRAFAVLALEMMRGEGGKRVTLDLIDAAAAVDGIVERDFPDNTEQDRRAIAKRWLEFECLGSGIIEKISGNRVRFWHLTFQEFLAALQLAWLGDGDGDEDWWPVLERRLDDPHWRETVELFPGCLLDEGGEGRVDKLLSRVLEPLEKEQGLGTTARIAGITGRLLQPLTVYDYKPEPVIRERNEAALEKSLAIFQPEGAKQVAIKTRIEAAEALGRGGDPRIARGKKNLIDVPGTEIKLGKYLVTVEEFQQFVEHPGYEVQDFWDDDGWKSIADEVAPGDWDTQLQTPNRPVVKISWYEAQAYCRWLSEVWRKTVRLPTIDEWKKAATPSKGKYPWGKKKPTEQLAWIPTEPFGPNIRVSAVA